METAQIETKPAESDTTSVTGQKSERFKYTDFKPEDGGTFENLKPSYYSKINIKKVMLEASEAPFAKRRRLINEVKTPEELCSSFDLTAFPLPMRVEMRQHQIFCGCATNDGPTAHVLMRVRPRNANELYGAPRAADGSIELRSCTGVSAASFAKDGGVASVEKIRVGIKNMVMHEVYEALLFKGERIMNPHSFDLKPADQPF